MGRQRIHNLTNRNSGSPLPLQPRVVSDEFFPDGIDNELPEKHPEEQPVFIARMPNLEKPRSLGIAGTSWSIWNRLVEMKNGITERQQIITLWCVIALLVCMLFWNMVGKSSPDSSDLAQTASTLPEDSLEATGELYRSDSRSEKTASSRAEIASEHLARNKMMPSPRDWNDEELSPVMPTTSIDLSESPEEAPSAFDSKRYAASPTSSHSPSAWDREAYSVPQVVSPQAILPNPAGGRPSNAASPEDSAPDFSAFSTPNYGATQPHVGNGFSVNRYNEPQVRQVQYHQNPVMVPATPMISNGNGSFPASSQAPPSGVPPFPMNANPGTGAYPTPQTPQSSTSYGQPYYPGTNYSTTTQSQYPAQYPVNAPQNQGQPYAYQNGAAYQQPNPSRYDAAGYREEIPATFSNNTYRNPGAPQPAPQNVNQQQVYQGRQYNDQPPYGTAVYPANNLNR